MKKPSSIILKYPKYSAWLLFTQITGQRAESNLSQLNLIIN